MKQYEYQSLSMTAWERSYEQLGMDGWVPVYVPSPRVWLMREIQPELETRELLRGAYKKPIVFEVEPVPEVEEYRKAVDKPFVYIPVPGVSQPTDEYESDSLNNA